MIRVQKNDIHTIADDFSKRIEDSVVKNRLNRQEFSAHAPLQMRIRELYSCQPYLLESKHKEFKEYVEQYHRADIDEIKYKYFDYENIIKYRKNGDSHDYWLVRKLNITVCPYCNRNYTHTIDNSRPQLDHFFCQDKYPYLALSFFNLMPSCSVCNHIKSSKKAGIHPYIDDFGDNCNFQIDHIEKCILGGSEADWDISFTPFTRDVLKHYRNIKTFSLREFYRQHKDYISEIVYKAQSYNNNYYDTLIETFSTSGLSTQEMNALIFGCYVEPENLGLRPLSKLTKDILNQLGVDPL